MKTIPTALSTLLAISEHYEGINIPKSTNDRQSFTLYACDISAADLAYLLNEATTEGRTLKYEYNLQQLHAIITYLNESYLTVVINSSL